MRPGIYLPSQDVESKVMCECLQQLAMLRLRRSNKRMHFARSCVLRPSEDAAVLPESHRHSNIPFDELQGSNEHIFDESPIRNPSLPSKVEWFVPVL